MYSVTQDDDGLMTIEQQKSRFSYKIHGLTNYPGYRFSHPFIFLKKKIGAGSEDFFIVETIPTVPERWREGNFIHHNGYEYRRLDQYEFDKLCYENEPFRERFPDNSKLYEELITKKLNL